MKRPKRVVLAQVAAVGLTIFSPPAFSQPSQDLKARREPIVPFVGCASSGQTGITPARSGHRRTVPISSEDAARLAHYESADGIGLLAPRGWFCEANSGSSGYMLFLSPKPLEHGPSGESGREGPAIEVYHMTSENSGRYEVAELLARLFPRYRAFGAAVLNSMDLTVPAGPYPQDSLTRKGEKIVEYATPSRTDGVGNFHSWLGKTDLPIHGAVVVVGEPKPDIWAGGQPHVVLLSVRLPPGLEALIPTIIGQFERDNLSPRQ